ncbi:MAG: choice-of-anchor B family protein [Flavobacteriales bacterium]|nr:choice-of-anchor B family protein [Flavobacteriales bacterium]
MKNLILTLTTCFLSILSFSQLNSTLLFHWNDTTIIGSAAYDNAYNECWGFEVNNTEIAVIGSTEGTHFFNVTDPQNSTEVAFVAGAYTGSGVVHRDYHDYQGYLYIVCDEGWSTSTLQIVDISNLPTSVNVVYDSDSLFNTSHNIFIDTATSKLYACASNSAMDIYSLDIPTLPNLIYSYTDVGHVHDAYVRNDTAYLNCGNDGFRIIDFHYLDLGGGMAWDELASFTSYPDAGYNHSGWLSDDGTIYAMQDENHGYDVKIIDVSDLNNITVLSTLNSGENAQSMAHNGIIKGDFLYLAYYHDGLRVFDISDPSNPIQVCNYDTYSPSSYNSYKGAWGVYPYLPSGNIIVSDMQSGLYVLDCTIPINSIKDINQNLNIYPNPAKDYFNVNIDANKIEIYDISSRKITQQIIATNHKFYRDNIANGLYIYRLFNERNLEIENGKIIFE